MREARFLAAAGLLVAAAALVVLCNVPAPSSLLSSSSSSSAATTTGLAHREAATEAAATAESLRLQARAAESSVQTDRLSLSRDRTVLARLKREMQQDNKASEGTAAYGDRVRDALAQVATDETDLRALEQRARNEAPRVADAESRINRATAAIKAAQLELKHEKKERAALRARAKKLDAEHAEAVKREKQLRQRSDRAFKRATTPGVVEWNHYADSGASLSMRAKEMRLEAEKLASEADNARIDASLVGGVHGSRDVEKALEEDQSELKFASKENDRTVVRHGNLLEKIAAAKTRLSAARMQASSYEKEESVAKATAKSMRKAQQRLKMHARKVRNEITELESDIKAKENTHRMLLRKATEQDKLSADQFKEMEDVN